MNTLVVCIGSVVAGDDTAGFSVYKCLGEHIGARLLFLGTDLFRLYGEYRGEERLVLVDAVHGIQDVTCLANERVFAIDDASEHAHHLSAVEALKILRLVMPAFPRDVYLVGVPAHRFDRATYRQEHLDAAVETVRKLVA
jgi:hydrogenase maturation protease